MAVYQGTALTKYVTLKDSEGVPLDITGWTFRAQLRDHPDDAIALGELTTENGGIVLVDEVNGRLGLVFDDALTEVLPVGRVHFDVLRENGASGPVWLFAGNFMVRQPITR